MAGKKASKSSKALGKKDLKKTKGGSFSFGSQQIPAVQSPTVDLGMKYLPGSQIGGGTL